MRSRRINYKQIIKNVKDQYPYGLEHGLQKDAVQNSWDARENKKGRGWRTEFDITPDEKFFIIQDFGTEGLTGHKIATDYPDLEDIPEEERWAKFECFGATKEDPDNLGSRGQGKLLFISASKTGKVFYDSLRKDGTYRFGFTCNYGEKLDCWDNDEAKKEIKKQVGLEPISTQGTRVIIDSPKDELIDYYRDGFFLSGIQETWWPLIEKYGAEIVLKDGGEEIEKAEVPPIFASFSSQKIRKELSRDEMQFEYGKNRSPGKIKRFHIACNDDELDSMFAGIAVFRDGMKVLNIRFDGSHEFNERIFGYVEFDKNTDRLLRDVENPNHYDFRREPLWKVAEKKIKNELSIFAEEKLGVGKKPHQEKINSQRNRKVQALASDVLKQLDIPIDLKKSWGVLQSSTTSSSSKTNNSTKTKWIYDDRVFYTNDSVKRIAYGDNLRCICKVKKGLSEKSRIRISILSGTSEVLLLKDSFISNTEIETNRIIDKKKIGKGYHTISFQLVRSSDKQILNEKRHALWVEDYPRGNFPFKLGHSKFLEDRKDIEWYLDYQNKNLDFNLSHPYREYVDSQGEDRLTRHEAELCVVAYVFSVVESVELGAVSKEKLEENGLLRGLISGDHLTKIAAGLHLQERIRYLLYGDKK